MGGKGGAGYRNSHQVALLLQKCNAKLERVRQRRERSSSKLSGRSDLQSGNASPLDTRQILGSHPKQTN